MADDQQMLRDHQQTWNDFTKLLFRSTVAVVLVLILAGLIWL